MAGDHSIDAELQRLLNSMPREEKLAEAMLDEFFRHKITLAQLLVMAAEQEASEESWPRSAMMAVHLVVSKRAGAERLMRDEGGALQLILGGLVGGSRNVRSQAARLLGTTVESSTSRPPSVLVDALGAACIEKDDIGVANEAAEAVAKMAKRWPDMARAALNSAKRDGTPSERVRMCDVAVRCSIASEEPEVFALHLEILVDLAVKSSDDPLSRLTALELCSRLAARTPGARFLLRRDRLARLLAIARDTEDPYHSGDHALSALGVSLGAAAAGFNDADWTALSESAEASEFLRISLERFCADGDRIAAFQALGHFAATERGLDRVLSDRVSELWLRSEDESKAVRTARLDSIAQAFSRTSSVDACDAMWRRFATPTVLAAIARDAATSQTEALRLAAIRLLSNAIQKTTTALSDLTVSDGFYEWLVKHDPNLPAVVNRSKYDLLEKAASKSPSPFNAATRAHLLKLRDLGPFRSGNLQGPSVPQVTSADR